jgi:hypothetical protein
VRSGDAGSVEKKQQAAARARSSGTMLLRLFLVVGRSATDLVESRWSVTIYLSLDFEVSV